MQTTFQLQTFPTPEAFFAAMFGPAQHDAHVRCRAAHLWLAEKGRELSVLDDVIAETLAESREREAQHLAEVHGYDTAALRRELHRFEAGCFSTEPYAKTRARKLGRALDIAVAWHGAASEAA